MTGKRRLTPEEAKRRQREAVKRWNKLHPDYHREWQAANREYVKLQKRIYRAKKQKAEQC
jgi:ferric-dicitrate binding protein FerR (iron transport regulator)